jgi:hypothetical protein
MYSRKFGVRLRGKWEETADDTDITDEFPRWRPTQMPYNRMLDSTRRVWTPRVSPILLYPCYPGNPWLSSPGCSVKNRLDSRLLVFAKFLEARVAAQRIEHWIEPQQRRSKGHA